MAFRVLHVDDKKMTMVIDWGWCMLTHPIPAAFLEDPDMPKAEVKKLIERMEPAKDQPVPQYLKDLIVPDDENPMARPAKKK